MSTQNKTISLAHAQAAMHHHGARLVKMVDGRDASRIHYFIVGMRNPPRGYIEQAVAEQLIVRLGLIGQKDGLFPGLDQTWRIPGAA
jgi:hypothetical protein